MYPEVERRKREGLHREMRLAEAANELFDSDALVFCSNNYLGLATDLRLADAVAEAARRYGTGAGASRLVSGNFGVHRELEDSLADLKDAEDALVFSSGYAANVGTISALVGEGDTVFSDELNHASIVDGCRLSGADVVVYDHCDAEDFRRKYRDAEGRRKLVVTDSVFSMDGDVAPLREICGAASDGLVMVDEAHATGVAGDEGGGVVQEMGLEDCVDVQMGTLSKALGSQGGYVAGSEPLVDLLVNEARSFVYSTGLSPVDAAAAKRAVELVRSDAGGELRSRLDRNVELLADGLEDLGYDVHRESHILPVMVGGSADAVELSRRLEEEDVYVPAIRPPTVPEGTSRLRVTVTAKHSRGEVMDALAAFKRAGREAEVVA